MMFDVEIKLLEEPKLEFGHRQTLTDPKRGLVLFGPNDLHSASQPQKVSYAVIGTQAGVDRFARWSEMWCKPIHTPPELKEKIWPSFPGFESVFEAKWESRAISSCIIDATRLESACRVKNLGERIKAVTALYADQIQHISKMDTTCNVIICVVPDEVSKTCRPLSNGRGGIGSDLPASLDFRRQIKAKAMEFRIPIQLLVYSTLAMTEEETVEAQRRFKRTLTTLSDRAWNLATTLYYKAGGRPWKLSGVRDGVCYIGLAFRVTNPNTYESKKSACCAAQMFLQDGDGVIFKGEDGVWYSPDDKVFHLDRTGAKAMIAGVLKQYESLHGKTLKEIFIHSPSELSKEEYLGFSDAAPAGAKVVAIRVKQESFLRGFRDGDWPMPRGSFLKLSDREAILWGSGFKYELSTYDGHDIPIPLQISIMHGEAEIETVARDILGLTKLNYNACKFGESEPVTIRFADAVGEILVANPGVNAQPQFRYYI